MLRRQEYLAMEDSSNDIIPTQKINSFSNLAVGTRVIKAEMFLIDNIRFDGDFEGKIKSAAKIIIGENSTIKADIFCDEIDIYGTFEGNLCAKNEMVLHSSCKISGSVRVGTLKVEQGSSFNGSCSSISASTFDEEYKSFLQ